MTPAERAQAEVRRFLSTSEPETLCINGDWGVGKTYIWAKILSEATNAKAVALPRYAYVSLFGVDGLHDLKLSIFENSDLLLKDDPSATGSLKRLGNWLFGLSRKSTPIVGELPLLGKPIKGAGALFFSSVRNQIVCIDDLERRGSKLPVADVLGLVNFLKEQRKCKVALLLNDAELDEVGRAEFDQNLEKVIDVKLKFAPTAAECVAIAVTVNGPASERIKKNCITLGISNIRVIKKIERHARHLEVLLAEYHDRVNHQAIQSLCLFAWSKYQPELAPPLDFLKSKRWGDFAGLGNGQEQTPEEDAWNSLLQIYDFGVIDDFDAVILDGIEAGYFDPERVRAEGEKTHRERVRQDKDGAFTEAWNLYHHSFADNADEVGQSLYDSFQSNFATISPSNLHGTIEVLKAIGQTDRALALLALYVAERKEERDFWDLDQHRLFRTFTDPDIVQAFADKHASFEAPDERPIDVLIKIAESNSWNEHDLNILAALSADDYTQIFLENTGDQLRAAVLAALQFGRIGNATPAMLAIANNARAALQRIAGTSPLNAMRVQKYGVRVDQGQNRALDG